MRTRPMQHRETVPGDRRRLRWSSRLAVICCGVFVFLLITLMFRLDVTWEFPVFSGMQTVSDRTRDILANAHGSIRIVCFMDRRAPLFRPVSRLLRGLRNASRGAAGAVVTVDYVDPRWDLARAKQLVASGTPENTIVFERGRRRIVVPVADMLATPEVEDTAQPRTPVVFLGESACASAIRRITLPYERSVVYWMTGHGETAFDDYDRTFGYSDIARELHRDGFQIKSLSFSAGATIPNDCHVLVIAGARMAYSEAEQRAIDTYLLHGGRLMTLLTPQTSGGVLSLLEKWGIRVTPFVAVGGDTLSGHDVVVSTFPDHAITRPLNRVSIVFGEAACLQTMDDMTRTGGVDRVKVTLLASTSATSWGESNPAVQPCAFDPASELAGPVAMAAVAERGGEVARDVAFRPTRVCVIGDAGFVMNGALVTRANANRDFFMNAMAWLAGIDATAATSLGGDTTWFTGFDRVAWIRFTAVATFGFPVVVMVLFGLAAWRKRM